MYRFHILHIFETIFCNFEIKGYFHYFLFIFFFFGGGGGGCGGGDIGSFY